MIISIAMHQHNADEISQECIESDKHRNAGIYPETAAQVRHVKFKFQRIKN